VRDVSYVSEGKKVEAYLALPPKAGKRPAVVYLHGSGGTRQDLLVQAVWLAGRGAVGLAITAPSTKAGAQPRGLTPLNALRRQRDLAVADVVAVRRGLDLLAARPDVDPKRLGFLGYSAGARTGALLAGWSRDSTPSCSGRAAPRRCRPTRPALRPACARRSGACSARSTR
jgi:dienelactone hydrolase